MMEVRDQEVLTICEVAEFLRVPEPNVRAEIESGRLPVISIGGEERILRADILALRQPKQSTPRLNRAKNFPFTWPSGKTEQFTGVVAGVVRVDDEWRSVSIGMTERKTAGRLRKRAVVFVNRRPRAEFVAADDFAQTGNMVSLIKTRSGRQIPPTEYLPQEYARFSVKRYDEYVTGPNSYSNLAVVCKSDDFECMTALALIRAGNDGRS